jgi:hypothetical protein
MGRLSQIGALRISEINLWKFLRNVFISLLSSAWLLPFKFAGLKFLDYMIWLDNSILKEYMSEKKDISYPFYYSYSPFAAVQGMFENAIDWLMIILFFWVLLAANKLWPIKSK